MTACLLVSVTSIMCLDMDTARDRVLAYYRAVDSGDNEALLAMFHPDAVYHRGGYPAIEGAKALRDFYENVRIIAEGEHTLDSVIAEGNQAAVRGSFTGISKDGESLSAEWADFFLLEGGLIKERFTYFFSAGV